MLPSVLADSEMVERTITLFYAWFLIWTRFRFIILRVVFKLFPSVTFAAFKFIGTSILIIQDEIRWAPWITRSWFVLKHTWLPPVVLPVMRIDTQSFVVLCEIKRTPHSLEVEHVEIIIVFEIMNQFYDNIVFGMREGAELAVVASTNVIGVVRTKFSFIFLRLIQLFDSVMRHETIVSSSTCFSFFDLGAEIAGIEMSRSFSVFGVVVELAVLVIVLSSNFAELAFEILEVKMFYNIWAIWAKRCCLNAWMSHVCFVTLIQLGSSFPEELK